MVRPGVAPFKHWILFAVCTSAGIFAGISVAVEFFSYSAALEAIWRGGTWTTLSVVEAAWISVGAFVGWLVGFVVAYVLDRRFVQR